MANDDKPISPDLVVPLVLGAAITCQDTIDRLIDTVGDLPRDAMPGDVYASLGQISSALCGLRWLCSRHNREREERNKEN